MRWWWVSFGFDEMSFSSFILRAESEYQVNKIMNTYKLDIDSVAAISELPRWTYESLKIADTYRMLNGSETKAILHKLSNHWEVKNE